MLGVARTCRRFYFLAWEPELWARIVFTEETKDTDRALKTTLALAARNGVCVSAAVRRVSLSGCGRLTDRGLALVARRCQLLEQLEVRKGLFPYYIISYNKQGSFQMITKDYSKGPRVV